MKPYRYLPMLLPFAAWVNRRLPFVSYRITQYLQTNTQRDSSSIPVTSVHWWAHVLTVGMVGWCICAVLAAVQQEMVWMILGVLCLPGFPYLLYRRHLEAVDRYLESIILEMPEFLQLLVIYLSAGATVHTAIQHCAGKWAEREGTTGFAILMKDVRLQLSYQESLSKILLNLAKSANSSEMRAIVSLLLTHSARGGEKAVETLMTLNRGMWQNRMMIVKKHAEEATVKLIFPLIVIFMAILIIVGAPAIMYVS